MNQHVSISYEETLKAKAREIRERLMGKPATVNVINEVLPKASKAKLSLPTTHYSLTVPMAFEQSFDRVAEVNFGPRTMKEIADEIMRNYPDLTMADIRGPSRARNIVQPRQLIVYAIKTELNKSFPEIGRFIGGRDHTTALHAYRRVAEARARAE